MKKIIFFILFFIHFFSFSQNVDVVVPKNNVVISDTIVSFKWNSISSAQSYRLQVSNNASFSSIVTDSLGILTTESTFSYNYSNTYYWRMKFFNGTSYSNWSNINSLASFMLLLFSSIVPR